MTSSFDAMDAEFVRLRQAVARMREAHPEWTLEEATHAAVEELNDPALERDSGFRKWLLARGKLVLARKTDVRSKDL